MAPHCTSTNKGGISVGVDDQLYKEDGTWVTTADNFLLKLATLVATPLLQEDDETYDRPFKAFLRVSSFMTLVGMIFVISINPPLVILFGSGWLIGPWAVSLTERCNARGSTIDLNHKWEGLLLLFSVVISTVFVPVSSALTSNPQIAASATWLLASMATFIFTMFYVLRLGTPPPKKKKAKAWKFATHQ